VGKGGVGESEKKRELRGGCIMKQECVWRLALGGEKKAKGRRSVCKKFEPKKKQLG